MNVVIKRVRNQYNRIARKYTKEAKDFNELIMHEEIIRLARKHGFEFKEKEILDLGCGPGGLMKKLLAMDADVHGIDISYKLISIAKERGIVLTRLQYGSVHEVSDMYCSGEFDAIFSNFVLHYLPPDLQQKTIHGVWKILKKGGLWIYSFCHPFFMRNGYFNPSSQIFPSLVLNYFEPITIDKWGEREFGESLTMYRLDWPDIYNMNREAGFDVLELVDMKLSENIDSILKNTSDQNVLELIQLFKTHPFAVCVVARK